MISRLYDYVLQVLIHTNKSIDTGEEYNTRVDKVTVH